MAGRASEPHVGQSRTAIILALIAAAQAILIALIGAGAVSLRRDPEPANRTTRISMDVIAFANVSPETCVNTMQLQLPRQQGFEYSNGGDDALIMRRGDLAAGLWCRPDGLLIAVAGPDAREARDAAELIAGVARNELGAATPQPPRVGSSR
jgi:hypothetical protein